MKILNLKLLKLGIIAVLGVVSLVIWKKELQAPTMKDQLEELNVNYQAEKAEEIIISQEEKKQDEEEKAETFELPAKFFIEVPFTAQAPFKNWDEYHEEACEEAALLMMKYFSDNKKLSPEIAEKEIQAMISFQLKEYGDYRDSDAKQIVRLANDFYALENLRVVYDFPKEDLKKWLAKGKPIIIPAAGRLLYNPNFTYPGPLYHNLILTGYEGEEFITNDPGTRKGEDYRYQEDILYGAIHDFTGKKEAIAEGRKAMVVME